MPPLKKIAFLINRSKTGAPALGDQLIAEAQRRGAVIKSTDAFPVPGDFLEGQDACCVIGGDGTLLSVIDAASRAEVPVFGVNRGNLGFLTTAGAEDAVEEFGAVMEGRYTVDHRSMLECRKGDTDEGGIALNDVVIKEEKTGRLATLQVQANEGIVTEFLCDGLIFSTPTGSTAYNLSAGGPIIEPQAHVIAMTPICPHTLSNRTVIFHEATQILVHNPVPSGSMGVTLDGHRHFGLESGEVLRIFLSERQFPLVQKKGYSHFAVVRTKLGWIGGRNDRGRPAGP